MSQTNKIDQPNKPVEPFASVTALKAAHVELLEKYREALGTRSVHDDNGSRLRALLPQVKSFIERGRLTGTLIEHEEDRISSQTYLDHWVSVLYRAGLYQEESDQYDATLEEYVLENSPSLDDQQCPYLGLEAFQEQDSKNFFGRTDLVDVMVRKLADEQLIAVVGQSGTGKSSAVLAGLMPSLKSGALPDSRRWRYYPPMVPGANPLLNLALSLKATKEGAAAWVEREVALFKQDPEHLLKLVEAAGNSPAVIVIDQFEEIFTICNDKVLLDHFINNLLRLIQSDKHRHRVILTMRSDFEEQLPRLEALYPLWPQSRIQVLPLSAKELRDAIEKPAEIVGLKFDKGIVDQLVKEIVGEPAGLPLLQFALFELWKKRRRNRVTWEVYDKLGGGAGQALTKSADEFYKGLKTPQKQIVMKRIMLRLAWASEGAEILRNRVRRHELQQAAGTPEQVDEVLRELVESRLVRLTKDELSPDSKESPDDQFEVTHEALIRNWFRLVGWLQDAGEDLRYRVRLRSAAQQWVAYNRDPGGLLGGTLLDVAMSYPDLDKIETEYVNASRLAVEKAEHEQKAAHEREVEQVKALAEERAKSAGRAKAIAAVLAIMLVGVGGMTIYAFRQQRLASQQAALASKSEIEALGQRREAESAKEAAQKAEKDATDDRTKAEIARDEAEKQRKKAETQERLAISREADARLARQAALKAKGEAEVANAQLIIKNNELQIARQQEAANAAMLAEAVAAKDVLLKEKDVFLKEQADALKEKVGLLENLRENFETLKLTQIESNQNNQILERELSRANQALGLSPVFSLDGERFLTVAADNKVRVWDTEAGGVINDLTADSKIVSATMSIDGKRVATADKDGNVLLFDASNGSLIRKFEKLLFASPSDVLFNTEPQKSRITKLILSSDSKKLAALNLTQGSIKVLDVNTGKTLDSIGGSDNPLVNIAFSHDGKLIATTGVDFETKLVKISGNQQIQTQLTTNVCKPSKVEILNYVPSPNLKLEFSLEKVCIAEPGGGLGDEGISLKAIPLAKTPLIAKQDRQAKKIVSLPLPAPEQIQPSTIKTPEVSIRPSPQPKINTGGRAKWSMTINLYKRMEDGSLTQILHLTYSSEEESWGRALEHLTNRGLTKEQIASISDDVNEYGARMSEIAELDSPRLTELAQELVSKVTIKLDLDDLGAK
jgi:hypothetical protein